MKCHFSTESRNNSFLQTLQAQRPAASYRPPSMEQPQQECRQVKVPSVTQKNTARYENPKGRQNASPVTQVPVIAEKPKAQATGLPETVDEEKKLSKSQRAKLRKKMREGRA